MPASRLRTLTALSGFLLLVALVAGAFLLCPTTASSQEHNAGELTNPLIWDFGDGPRMIRFKFLGISFRRLSLPERIFWGKLQGSDGQKLEDTMCARYYYPQNINVQDTKAYLYQLPLQPALDAAGMKFRILWKQPYDVKIKMEGMPHLPPMAQQLITQAMGTDKMKAMAKIMMLPSPRDDGRKLPRSVGRVALTPLGFVYLGLLRYGSPGSSGADWSKMMGAVGSISNSVSSLFGGGGNFNQLGSALGNASSTLQSAMGKASQLTDPAGVDAIMDDLQNGSGMFGDAANELSALSNRAGAALNGLNNTLANLGGQATELQQLRDSITGTTAQAQQLKNQLDQQLANVLAQKAQVDKQIQDLSNFQNQLGQKLGAGALQDMAQQILGRIGDVNSNLSSAMGQIGNLTGMFNQVAGSTGSVADLVNGARSGRFGGSNSANAFFSGAEETGKSYTILPTLDCLFMSSRAVGEDGESWHTVFPIPAPFTGPLSIAQTPIVGFVGLMYYPIQFGIPLPPIPDSFSLRILGPADMKAALPYAYLSIPLLGGDPSIAFFYGYEVNRGIPNDQMAQDQVMDPPTKDNRTGKEREEAVAVMKDAAAAVEDKRMNTPIASAAARPMACFAAQGAYLNAAKAFEDTAGSAPMPDTEDPAARGYKASVEGEAAASAAAREAMIRAATLAHLATQVANRLHLDNFPTLPDPPQDYFMFWSWGNNDHDWDRAKNDATAYLSGVQNIPNLDPENPSNKPEDAWIKTQLWKMKNALTNATRTSEISFCRAWESFNAAGEGQESARLAEGRALWAQTMAQQAESVMLSIAPGLDIKTRKHLLRVTQAAAHLAQRTADVAGVKANSVQQSAARAGEAGWCCREAVGPQFPRLTPAERESDTHPAVQNIDENDPGPDEPDAQLKAAMQSGNMLSVAYHLNRVAGQLAGDLPDQNSAVTYPTNRALTWRERLLAIRRLALRAVDQCALACGQAYNRANASQSRQSINEARVAALRAKADQMRLDCATHVDPADVEGLQNWQGMKGQPFDPATCAQKIAAANTAATVAANAAKAAADAAEAADLAAQTMETKAAGAFSSYVESPIASATLQVLRSNTVARQATQYPPSANQQKITGLVSASITAAIATFPLRITAQVLRAQADFAAWQSALLQITAQEAEEVLDDIKRRCGAKGDSSLKQGSQQLTKALDQIAEGDTVGAMGALNQLAGRGLEDTVGRRATQIGQGLRAGFVMTLDLARDHAKFFSGNEIRKAAETLNTIGRIFPGNDPIGNQARDLGNQLGLPNVSEPSDPELRAAARTADELNGGGGLGGLRSVVVTGFNTGAGAGAGAGNGSGSGGGAGSGAKSKADAKRDDEARRLYELGQQREKDGKPVEALQAYALVVSQFGKTGLKDQDSPFAPLSAARIEVLMGDPAIRRMVEDGAEALMKIAAEREAAKDFPTALKFYDRVVAEYPTSKQAPIALERARKIRAALAAGKLDELGPIPTEATIPTVIGGGLDESESAAALEARIKLLYDAADALLKNGDFPGAIAGFHGVATDYPTHPLGKQAAEQRDALMAQEGVRTLLEERAKDFFAKGEAAQLAKDTKNAILNFSTVVTRFPTSVLAPDAEKRLVLLTGSTGTGPGAFGAGGGGGGGLAATRDAIGAGLGKGIRFDHENPDEAKRLFEYGQALEQSGNFPEALRVYSMVVSTFGKTAMPGLDSPYAGLAQARINVIMGSPEWNRLVADGAEALMRQAEEKEGGKEYAKAITLYDLVVQQYPTSPQAPIAADRAARLREAVKTGADPGAGAIGRLPSGAAGATDSPAAQEARLKALFDAANGLVAGGDFPGAIETFNGLAVGYPTSAIGKQAGEQRDALMQVPGVRALIEERAKEFFYRGENYQKASDRGRAAANFAIVVRRFPTSSFAAEAQKRLDLLEGRVPAGAAAGAGEAEAGAGAAAGEGDLSQLYPADQQTLVDETAARDLLETAEGNLKANDVRQALTDFFNASSMFAGTPSGAAAGRRMGEILKDAGKSGALLAGAQEIFAQAEAARNGGNLGTAADGYRQLVTKYPFSPLYPQARKRLGEIEGHK